MEFTKRIGKELALESLLFAGGILAAYLWWRNNVVLTAAFLVLWLIGLSVWHTKKDVFFFFTGAITGPLVEIIMIAFGVWQYTHPSFLGIPLWLPVAWGMVVVLMKRFAETFFAMFAEQG